MSVEHREGFLDLAGRKLGNVEILHIVRRHPQIVWQCRCSRCGSSWVSTHVLLVNNSVECPNRSCGRSAPAPTSETPFTRVYAPPAPRPAPVRAPQPSAAAIGNADPKAMQMYLDSLERQKGR
jgi:hypothetical protein